MKRLILLIVLTAAMAHLSAQNLFNGYGKTSVYGGSSKYDLSSVFAEFSLQTSLAKGAAILKSDIRLRKGQFFGHDEQSILIQELYTGYNSEKLDIFLGNQIINWGRADGFNPTGNITSKDYFFLTADPDDQKQSNFMLRVNIRPLPGMSIELIGIPFYKMSDYRFDLFELGSNVTVSDNILPGNSLKNGSAAIRLDFEYPAIGGSLSFFNGYDPYHGFNVTSVDWSSGEPAVYIASAPYRKTTIGGDLAVPVCEWIIRAEAAYNSTGNPDNLMYIPNSDLSYVAGVERTIAGITLIGQYIGKYTLDFTPLTAPVLTDPTNPLDLIQYANATIDYMNRQFNRKLFNQQERTNHAVSLTATRSFAYDLLMAELSAYYNFTSDEWMVRPKVTWKISDALSLTAGGNYMKGSSQSLFGYSSPIMNGLFTELKIQF